ncbi:MAG TPA: hypothetical protein VJ723_12920, partial [Candidatus Angelobacter sp.]|nr:hypothetical protein [Candidatus Angelobacter sp.]
DDPVRLSMTRCRISAALCLLLMVSLGAAQTTPNNSAPPVKSDLPLTLVVVEQNEHRTTTTQSELDRPITVALKGLKEWLAKNPDKHPRDLRLYLAGHKLAKCSPTLTSVEQEYLDFHLEIDPADRDAWVDILYDARNEPDHKLPLSIGWKDNMQVFDSNAELALIVYSSHTPYILGLLVLLLAATLILSVRTNLLRDGTDQPPAPARSPYNLGKVQMAFWFYLTITAYLYVWLITGEYDTVTSSVLVLIGISAGTGAAALLVDKQKVQEIITQRTSLDAQLTALQARINDLSAAAPQPGSPLDQELQQKKNSLLEVQAQLAHAPVTPPPAASKGFLKDILSDGEGVAFHRFQMVVWTLVFGLIFVRSVYRDLSMPNFDASLLGLMGISSGTYIGFKFPEKPK